MTGTVDADGDVTLRGSYSWDNKTNHTSISATISGTELEGSGRRGPRFCRIKMTQLSAPTNTSEVESPIGTSTAAPIVKTPTLAETKKSAAVTTIVEPTTNQQSIIAEAKPAPTGPLSANTSLEPVDAVYVAIQSANVRRGPDSSTDRVATLRAGEKVTVLARVKDKGWFQISRNEVALGYVVATQLVPEVDYEKHLQATGAVQSSAPNAQSEPVAKELSDFANLDFGRYYAVVIGNDNYRSMPRLRTARADAKAVADVLKQSYGFNVVLLTDASRSQILGAISRLRQQLAATDNLLIYYGGHGFYDADTDQGYWLPVDADRENPANWISNYDITGILRALKAKHVMVVADSCYSGTLTRGVDLPIRELEYYRRIVGKKARTVLTSGGLEPVADGGGGEHSVFARAFLEALQQNSSALDGQKLFERVRESVVLNALQTPEYSNIRLAGHEGGDFVFIRR